MKPAFSRAGHLGAAQDGSEQDQSPDPEQHEQEAFELFRIEV